MTRDGQEIWEGDILHGEYAENCSKESVKRQVIYDTKRGVWCLKDSVIIGELSERGSTEIPILLPLMLFKNLTVIGNVYEHPELLEDTP